MSLIRSRWILLACTSCACAIILWHSLAPTNQLEPSPPPIGRVDIDYFPPAPLDLALSARLFAQAPPPATTTTNETAGANASSAPTSPPRLVGIAARNRGASVALAVDQSGQTRVLKSGDDIDGWTLANVGADHVTFSLGDRKVRVALDFSNKVGGNAAPTRQLNDSGGQN